MSLSEQIFIMPNNIEFNCYIFIIVAENGERIFWFKAKDVAEFLGYSSTDQTIRKLIPEEWKTNWNKLSFQLHRDKNLHTPSNWQNNTIFITEPGLWILISRSKKPEAIKFQKWLFEEVLPNLRKKFFFEYFNSGIRARMQDAIDLLNVNDKKGFVYFATNSYLKTRHLYKIGCTGNLQNRLMSLNCSSIDDFFFDYVFECADKLRCEKLAHEFLVDKCVKREFYEIKDLDIIKSTMEYMSINVCEDE